jgi:hypothetical protein
MQLTQPHLKFERPFFYKLTNLNDTLFFIFVECKLRISSCSSLKNLLWETMESSHSEKSQSLSSTSDHSVSTLNRPCQPGRPLFALFQFFLIYYNNYRLHHPFKWNYSLLRENPRSHCQVSKITFLVFQHITNVTSLSSYSIGVYVGAGSRNEDL